jgi:hypothetical protein
MRVGADATRKTAQKLFSEYLPAAGTSAAVNWRDYGRSRWQLSEKSTPNSDASGRGDSEGFRYHILQRGKRLLAHHVDRTIWPRLRRIGGMSTRKLHNVPPEGAKAIPIPILQKGTTISAFHPLRRSSVHRSNVSPLGGRQIGETSS